MTKPSPILIVGAGPVGLTMALLLNNYGLDVRIIEKDRAPQIQTKAAGLWSRTLEVLEHLELAETFLEHSHLASTFSIFAGGKRALSLKLDKIPSRYNFITLIPQHRTEALLTQALHERGVSVERGVKLSSWDGCKATLESEQGKEVLEPRFLLGCDGARSQVRKECGLPFTGTTLDGVWLVGDMRADSPALLGGDPVAFMSPSGPLALFPLGEERYRIVVSADSSYSRGDQPTVEDFHKLATDRVPGAITFSEGEHMTVFVIHERQVESYRSGSAFLLGDAAHIHSPAGGQGLNTGLQDAFNLAWKLSQVVKHGAPESLLESYQEERFPVAAQVLAGSTLATQMTSLKNPLARAVRNTALGVIGSLEPVLEKVRSTLSETDIHYRDSSLSGPHGPGNLKPGDRIPELAGTDGAGMPQRIQALFKGERWTLLCFGQSSTVWDSTKLDVVQLGLTGPLAEGCGMQGGGWLLVRPDGYLAASFESGSVNEVREYLLSHVGYDGLE